MKFKVKNQLKRLCMCFITLSLCVSSAGITSLATYSDSENNKGIASKGGFQEELSTDEIYIEKEADYIDIATASNAVTVSEQIVTVTNADEFLEAVNGETNIIELASDIYLDGMIEVNTNLILRAKSDVENVSLYSSDNFRHFLILGDEIELITENVIIDGEMDGGGIISYAEHFIFDGIIQNCQPSVEQGGAIETYGDLTINGGEIKHNNSDIGGAIYAGSNSSVIICNGIISDNSAKLGGGIVIDDFSTLTITGGNIHQNSAEEGGGIAILGNSIMILNDGIISENQAVLGGGIYDFNGDVYINGGLIFKNNARYGGGLGGGYYIANVDTSKIVEINGGTISENRAESGAGIAMDCDAEITINGGVICRNVASGTGGGLWVEASELKMSGGKIYENNAETGGAIAAGCSGIIEIVSGEIYNNVAEYFSGGISFVDFERVIISGDAIIKDNYAPQAYYLTDDYIIELHNQKIPLTVTWTDGFDYIYNGLDVQDMGGIPVNVYSVRITEYFSELEETSSYSHINIEGNPFHYNVNIPNGYEMVIETEADINANLEAGTIDIEEVTSNIEIFITYQPIEDENVHTVTVITHYTDGVKADESTSYRVRSGEAFEETYEALEGYEFAGISVRSYPLVDGDTRTISIDSVNEDYTITVKLARKSLNVKITTQYVNGVLPDETNLYSVLYGDNFAQSYDALDGYTFVGMSVRSYPYVDGDLQMVYIDEVKEDYEIIIKLDRAEYNVTIVVQYPEGTVENQVSTYSVLYGDSFLEAFEVESGYRIAAVQTEKGVDVDFQSKVVEIEAVKKDMLVTIICR